MSGVTLRTDEWGSLEPEIASKAKRCRCIQLATAKHNEGSMMWGYSMNIIDDVGIFKEYYYKVLRIVIVIVPIFN